MSTLTQSTLSFAYGGPGEIRTVETEFGPVAVPLWFCHCCGKHTRNPLEAGWIAAGVVAGDGGMPICALLPSGLYCGQECLRIDLAQRLLVNLAPAEVER